MSRQITLPGGRLFTPDPSDAFFARPLPRSTPAPGQRVVDLRDMVKQRRWLPLEVQPRAAELNLVARRQHSPRWFEERHESGITGTTLQKFLGFTFGAGADVLGTIRGQRDKTWRTWETPYDAAKQAGGGDLEFEDDRDEARGRECMAWGTEHEDDVLATLLDVRPTIALRECTLQHLPCEGTPAETPAPVPAPAADRKRKNDETESGGDEEQAAKRSQPSTPLVAPSQSDDDAADTEDATAGSRKRKHEEEQEQTRRVVRQRITSSQDGAGVIWNGAVDADGMPLGTKISVEFKCPYGQRLPKAYAKVPAYYLPQTLAHMEVEQSERCYVAAWTPTETRIWLVPRCKELFDRIATYVAAVLAADVWTLRDSVLLDEAAALRQQITRYAAACKELPGSPFASCFAARDEQGRVYGTDGVGIGPEDCK